MRLIAAVSCVVLLAGPASGALAPASEPKPAPVRPGPWKPNLPEVPAADFRELCKGHVTGAPAPDGKPGPHVLWTAYSSPSSTEELARRHAARLRAAAHETHESCERWRFDDAARHVWDLCPVAVPGPAKECAPPPAGTASILVVSTMAGGD